MKDFLITEESVREYADKIAGWIKVKVSEAKSKGLYLGMSGGVDCSVAGRLAQLAGVPIKLLMMPDGDNMARSKSRDCALEYVKKFDFSLSVIDISAACLAFEKELSDAGLLAKSNIRPRVRMIYLYALAQKDGFLVMGTGNLCERLLGYFTKWGDGAHDLNPLGNLTKGEVYILAKYLGVPKSIIERKPSADLFEGQTDEAELEFAYKDMDKYIIYGTSGDDNIDRKIEARIKAAAHKNSPISVFSG